jgi:AcrR family transcriptional regulator
MPRSVIAGPTRREQRREQTLGEIKSLAMEQVAAGGPDAVSLNGIARTMAMSPAAIYRYFDSRDALLADLVVDCYDALADALEAAVVPGAPRDQLAAVARAYRHWALENGNAYRLIFQSTSGSGQDLAPDRTIPAASRSMGTVLRVLAGVAADGSPGSVAGTDPRLVDQVREWAARTSMPDLAPQLMLLGLTAWTRMHGAVSLELGHHLGSTGVDPALLYEAEIAALAAAAIGVADPVA